MCINLMYSRLVCLFYCNVLYLLEVEMTVLTSCWRAECIISNNVTAFVKNRHITQNKPEKT